MATRHDDRVEVTLDAAGAPAAFVWERFEYFVTGLPQRYYRRRGRWWRNLRIIDDLDVEVWRVQAAMLGDQARLFDLRHDPDGWTLELDWG